MSMRLPWEDLLPGPEAALGPSRQVIESQWISSVAPRPLPVEVVTGTVRRPGAVEPWTYLEPDEPHRASPGGPAGTAPTREAPCRTAWLGDALRASVGCVACSQTVVAEAVHGRVYS